MYSKQVFADVASGKLNFEAKRAVERVGVNALDLVEKTEEEFNYKAKGEGDVPAEMVSLRYFHYENRRRKKLKIVAEYLR